jgi:hypothetical protein
MNLTKATVASILSFPELHAPWRGELLSALYLLG